MIRNDHCSVTRELSPLLKWHLGLANGAASDTQTFINTISSGLLPNAFVLMGGITCRKYLRHDSKVCLLCALQAVIRLIIKKKTSQNSEIFFNVFSSLSVSTYLLTVSQLLSSFDSFLQALSSSTVYSAADPDTRV